MKMDPRFLRCRFVRRLDWEEGEGGRVIVHRPRFGEGRFGRWLASALGLAPYRIRLDSIGTAVWRCCDGQTPAQEVADRIRSEFGASVEPAEARLYEFIVQMSRARMIVIQSDR